MNDPTAINGCGCSLYRICRPNSQQQNDNTNTIRIVVIDAHSLDARDGNTLLIQFIHPFISTNQRPEEAEPRDACREDEIR